MTLVHNERCELFNILFTKFWLLVIDDKAWNTHHMIFVFKFSKVVEVIDIDMNMLIKGCKSPAATTRSGHIVQLKDTMMVIWTSLLMDSIVDFKDGSMGCPLEAILYRVKTKDVNSCPPGAP